MCDENMNLEEQVTEPVEPKVETEPLLRKWWILIHSASQISVQ